LSAFRLVEGVAFRGLVNLLVMRQGKRACSVVWCLADGRWTHGGLDCLSLATIGIGVIAPDHHIEIALTPYHRRREVDHRAVENHSRWPRATLGLINGRARPPRPPSP